LSYDTIIYQNVLILFIIIYATRRVSVEFDDYTELDSSVPLMIA